MLGREPLYAESPLTTPIPRWLGTPGRFPSRLLLHSRCGPGPRGGRGRRRPTRGSLQGRPSPGSRLSALWPALPSLKCSFCWGGGALPAGSQALGTHPPITFACFPPREGHLCSGWGGAATQDQLQLRRSVARGRNDSPCSPCLSLTAGDFVDKL